jgi:hypothetical protein
MIERRKELEQTPAVVFPRPLRVRERELIESVLPLDRPGYRAYRESIGKMIVLGEGRRGAGNIVIGMQGDVADVVSPLPPVVAYGCVETTQQTFTITVRENVGDQIDVEIVSSQGDEVPEHFEEKRRWSYSDWLPGKPLPSSGEVPREIAIDTRSVLAIAPREKRILVHDGLTGMNHLIPVTNFYNELMLQKGVRDPAVALKSDLLFVNLATFSNEELRLSFMTYNTRKRRITIVDPPATPPPDGSPSFLNFLFRKKKP